MKNTYDVFNGDADGICALLQLRLANAKDSLLISGVKRDIQLLDQVQASAGDEVTVLDISMDKNKRALLKLLDDGAKVLYIDHHMTGELPEHHHLHAIINTAPTTCTSLLTNDYLKGQFAKWAVVGAYGDNMQASAEKLSAHLNIEEKDRNQLKKLGTAINYNGYGSSLNDLHYHPIKLYQSLYHYADPLECIADESSVYEPLYAAYEADINLTKPLQAEYSTHFVAVFMLPDKPWARRVSGVFGNSLANQFPQRAHSILSHHPEGGYVVSVRAPKNHLQGAGQLCQQFSGGGREGAAGINQLPVDQLKTFIDAFEATYKTP